MLCLAAREWIFRRFPEFSVGSMVTREAMLVSNEALAFLCIRSGLHKHLNHRDQTLPGRIEEYTAELSGKRGGLWGTSPPKPLADLVESLLGMVHMDAGFEAAQASARHVLSPALKILETLKNDHNIVEHPKKRLKELNASMVKINTFSGDSFAERFPQVKVWNGHNWGPPNKGKIVAHFHGLGRTLIAVSGATESAAINLGCISILATLDAAPNLRNRFRAAGSSMQKHLTAISHAKRSKSKDWDDKASTIDK